MPAIPNICTDQSPAGDACGTCDGCQRMVADLEVERLMAELTTAIDHARSLLNKSKYGVLAPPVPRTATFEVPVTCFVTVTEGNPDGPNTIDGLKVTKMHLLSPLTLDDATLYEWTPNDGDYAIDMEAWCNKAETVLDETCWEPIEGLPANITWSA